MISTNLSLLTKGPFGDGVAITSELRFTTAAGALSDAVPKAPSGGPRDFRGKQIEILNESVVAGEIVAFLFSHAAIAVTAGVATATGDPSATRGRLIMPGERLRVKLPEPLASANFDGDVFFNRIALSGTPNISISLVE
jgi:hypothetical protein